MAKQTAPKKSAAKKIKAELEAPYERPLMDELEDPGPLPKKLNESFTPADFKKPKIEIVKGKLLKEKVLIEYTKQDSLEEKPANCTYEHTAPPRKQLKNAFASLAVHCALLGEFIPLTSIDEILEPDPELIKDFNLSGFTLVAPGEDEEGVILTAQKTLKSGKILGFNTPIIRFADDSENSYPHLEELSDGIDLCKQEMSLYLNGTHEPDPQLKMEFE